jgi:asparagine synthase (glutamine-hydrolysing)
MTSARYLIAISQDPGTVDAWADQNAMTLADRMGLDVIRVGDCAVLLAPGSAAVAMGDRGYIVGEIFSRGRRVPEYALGLEDAERVVNSRGEWLMQAYWGRYVGLLMPVGRGAPEVLRPPFGELPCFYTEARRVTFASSDLELLLAGANVSPSVDWAALARHVAAPLLGRAETCLADVRELSGGCRLSVGAFGSSPEPVWDIWKLTDPSRMIVDGEEAAHRLRDAVLAVVAGLASEKSPALLRLSGGLDSSIVAASLSAGERPFSALTFTTRDAAGDERIHARRVADHLGFRLLEAGRSIDAIDVGRSDSANMPRPTGRAFAQASTCAIHAAARETGSKVVFDGGGGDNVFASICSPAPVADCLRADRSGGSFWGTARSIGVAAGTSTFRVARAAVWRHLTRGPEYRWTVDLSLLSEHGRRFATGAVDHAWLRPPAGAMAASAAHVALLAAAASVVDNRDVTTGLREVSPLIAQPVVEVALRIPGWLWTDEGHDRAIARKAFAAMLPAEIAFRRDKGSPDGFITLAFEKNWERIRELLIDGRLVAAGLVDKAALEAAFVESRSLRGFIHRRLMLLLDAEAWARAWS